MCLKKLLIQDLYVMQVCSFLYIVEPEKRVKTQYAHFGTLFSIITSPQFEYSTLDDKGYNAISIEDCISLWQKKDSDPQLVRAFATIPNTVGHMLSRHYPRTCKICDMRVENLTEHRLSFCVSCEKQRKRLVYAIYDQCGVEQFNKLKRLSLKDQCAQIIGLATQCVNLQPRFPSITLLLGRVLRSQLYHIIIMFDMLKSVYVLCMVILNDYSLLLSLFFRFW